MKAYVVSVGGNILAVVSTIPRAVLHLEKSVYGEVSDVREPTGPLAKAGFRYGALHGLRLAIESEGIESVQIAAHDMTAKAGSDTLEWSLDLANDFDPSHLLTKALLKLEGGEMDIDAVREELEFDLSEGIAKGRRFSESDADFLERLTDYENAMNGPYIINAGAPTEIAISTISECALTAFDNVSRAAFPELYRAAALKA